MRPSIRSTAPSKSRTALKPLDAPAWPCVVDSGLEFPVPSGNRTVLFREAHGCAPGPTCKLVRRAWECSACPMPK
eukprot:1215756-Prymnesium_polylepis.1